MTHYLYHLVLIAMIPTAAFAANDVTYECETLVDINLQVDGADLSLPRGTTFRYKVYGTITGEIFANEYIQLTNGNLMRRSVIPVPDGGGELPIILISERPDMPMPNGANSVAVYDNQGRTFLTTEDMARPDKATVPINCETVDGNS